MLGSVVYQVLAGYLGHYVKDMQREQFRIGLWSGEVLLENVDLRLEAFDSLQLPLSIKQASIGKLRILVPWKKLGWEPILISLEDVTIRAGPQDDGGWDAEASERRELAAKKAALASAEIAKFSKCVSETKSGQSFLSNFFGKIIDNVQVVVRNVHIQYMDKKTDPEVMFLVGLTLSGLTVSTSDASFAGYTGGGKIRGSQEHKVVEVKQLAIYWNPQSHPLGASLEAKDNQIISVLKREEDTPGKVIYLLRPTDVTLKLLLNKNMTGEDGAAQYAVVINVDDLSLALEDLQLRGMLLLFDAISIARAREKYGRFRPQANEGQDGANTEWKKCLWQYAIDAVLSDVRKTLWRRSLGYLVWRRAYRERYVDLYIDKLENLQRGQPSGEEESAELEEIERQFEMDEILFFRSLAEREMPLEDIFGNAAILEDESGGGAEGPTAEDLLTPEPVLQQKGWLNWLSLGLLGAADRPDAGQIFPQEIIKDLYEAAKLHPMPMLESGESSKGLCHLAITLHVGELLGSLHSSNLGQDILNVSVQGIAMTAQMWIEKTTVSVMVRTLEAVDLCTPGTRYPRILAPWGKLTPWASQRKPARRSYAEALAGSGLVRSVSDGSMSILQGSLASDEDGSRGEKSEPLLRLELELQPKRSDHDLTLTVVLQPVEFVYSETLIKRASSFFSFPASQEVLNDQVDSALKKLEDITVTNFKHKVAERKRLRLLLDIRKPNFLFPESSLTSNGILMILAVDSIILGSQELRYAVEDASSKGLSRTAVLRKHIGIFPSTQGQHGRSQDIADIPLDKYGHYDRFQLRLSGAQVLISGNSGDWHETLNSHESDMEWHLVKRFNLQVTIDICIKEDLFLPRLKIYGNLPALRLHFSLGKCRAVNDLLSKLLEGGQLGKGAMDTSASQRPFHVAEENTLFTWEMSLKLKVVTVELSLDGERHDAPTHMEKKTLVAQGQDMSVICVQRSSHLDLELLVRTVHVEDGSELATSPFRYLLYCAGCHRSVSPRPIVDTKAVLSRPAGSSEEKYAVCLKMVVGGPTGVPTLGVMAALHGLEFHIYPKVFRALHAFALAATTPKASASSGIAQNLSAISDAFPNGFAPDIHSSNDNYMDGEETRLRSVFSGLPIKSPVYNQMQAIALSPTSSSHPSGSVPSNMNSEDGGDYGESKDSLLSFFEKLTCQLLPLSAMFQNQVARHDSVIIDVQLKNCGIHFLDAGGAVGVVLLPDATVCYSIPFAASSSTQSWEIVAVSSDLQLKGTHWASGNISEDPVGSLSSGPTSSWDVRVRKSEKGNLDVVFQIHNAQVVLLGDYLAGLIQYFDSAHWISPSKSNSRNAAKSSTICWKVEVEDSVLFLPRVQGKDEFVQLVLGEFLFTTVDDHNLTTSYYIVGQKVSVRVHGTGVDVDDRSDADFGKSNGGQTLVDRWDGELLIEIPPANFPTCLEIHSSVLELILDGNVLEQVEAFQLISQDLSDIEWTLNTMALTTAHGGLTSWIPGKHVNLHSPATGSVTLKFCALKVCITFATLAPGNKSLLPVAVFQVDTIDAHLSLTHGILDALALEVLSIVLFSHAPKLKLLQCKGGDEFAIQPALKLLVKSEGPEIEVHISLPSTQVWLHVAAWNAIGPVIAANLKQSKPQLVSGDAGLLEPIAESSKPPPKVEILVLQEDPDSSFSPPQHTHPLNARTVPTSSSVDIPTSKLQQPKNAAVLVKVGAFRLALLVLDSPSKTQESERVVQDEDPSLIQETLPGKLISCTLSLRVDEFRFNKDGTWTLAAGITQGEGNVVDTSEDQDAFQELFFQATEISVSIDGSFQSSPIVRFDLKLNVDCINFWCSYPILLFFRQFTFEELQSGPAPSLDAEGKAEICLQHASVLLSDGRWSCKAPIVELLLGNIIAHASYRAQKLEASLSSDLEANYHNMHKVSWEPLVEPWNVNSILTIENATGVSKSQDCTRIKVSSSAKLNINVTESLVQAVSRAAEMAHDAWTDDSMARDTRLGNSSQYAPYWLQNDTGVAITYWLIGSRHNRDDMNDMDGGFGGWGSGGGTVLEPGKSEALYQQGSVEEISSRKKSSGFLSSAEPAKMFEVLLQHRMICVQIEGTSGPSPPLSIDLVGSRSFEASFSENESGDGYNSSLNSTPGNLSRQNSFQKLEIDNREKGDVFRTLVVFEVTIQRYSKLVRLCSTVSVVNMISVPLEIRFDIPFTISPKVMEPVLPGQVMPLPVHLAQTGKFRWRPLGNKYVWSEVQSIRHLLQSSESTQGLHRPVLCYPNSRTSRPFRCCLSVSHSSIAAVDSNFGELMQAPEVGRVSMERPKEFKLWDITLQAPLVVKNCLPLPVSITINSGTGTIVSHTAAEGNSKFVYDVDTVHNLHVTFRVRGFVTSSATIMQAAQSISESSRRSDKEGRIRAVEPVNFFPEIMSDPVVAAELELIINMISGTREICISVPFWLYNCSSYNLAVIDGDVDAFSGRQKYLAKVTIESSDKEKQQTDTRPGLAILQTGEQQPGEISFGWFPKRGIRFVSQRKTLSNSKLITADAQESMSLKGEILEDYWKLLVPHMYSPVKGTESSEHRLRVRVVHPVHMETPYSIEQSWSRPFSVDIPDGSSTLTVPRPQKQGAYVFSVICNPVLGSGAGKSKTVTFRPRFLVANSCKRDLCVKQQGTDAFERLPVGQHCHLHWTDMNRALLVSVRFSDHGWDWSGGFAPDQLGDTQVKVRNHASGATQMLRVEVSNMTPSDTSSSKGVGPGIGNLGTCLILLSDDETGFMPYRIDNFSMERIRFHQQKCEKMENMLHPYSSFCYAWDEPCDPHRLVLEIPGGGPLGVYGLDEVKEYSPVTLLSTSQKPERTFIVSVRAEGPIRVLSIADTSLHLMKNPSESSSVFPSNQPFATPNSHVLECTVTDTESVTELCVDFSFVGLSLIDSIPQEIIFACAKGLCLQLVQGQHQQQLKMEISVIQIDNQLRFAVYPVLLSSTYPHKKIDVVDNSTRVGKELKPSEGAILTLLIAKWRHPAGSVDCFQCISLRLVPMRLEVEEQVVSSLLGFMDKATESFPGMKMDKVGSSKVPSWSLLRWNRFNGQDQFAGRPWKFEVIQVSTLQSREVRFRKVVKRLEEYQCWASVGAVEPVGGPHQKLPLLAKEKSKAYIEILDISPIELTVSFSSTPWLSNNSEAATKNSLLWMTGMMLQHHVMAIADAEDAVMNLRRLMLAHPLASWDAIRGMITRHYTRQLFQEVYKVVGSADVLGNPIHFVRTLGSGMWDFVSTPAKSLNQSPRQLARGLVQGTHSLFSNTIFAFSNAATRMSKVARKTVTAFAFDKEYVDKMERREHSHGMEDLSVVNEFLEGLTGLLQSPVRGAERAGLPGMLSGAAVGALGVVARPVATILEVASKTGQSIVNRSSPKQWRATRIRLPRHLREDSPLLPYSWENAVGRAVLLETDGGCFRNEVLMLCLPLAHGNEFVLLTHTRILKVSSVKVDYLSGFKWHMELVAAVEDILHVDHLENRVNILLGPARREFVRTQHYSGLGHKVMSLPAHETLEFLDENALQQFLVVLRFLEDRLQHSRSTILISTRTL